MTDNGATASDDNAGADLKVYTPDECQAVLQRLASAVIELGEVDWTALIPQDDTPAAGMVRVSTLVNACGMLGSLALQAQAPMQDFFDGLVAATLAGVAEQGTPDA